MRPIPAPGYQRISGHRKPPASMGDKLYVQIRGAGATTGLCDPVPWPVETTRWKWEIGPDGKIIEHPSDVVAIKQP